MALKSPLSDTDAMGITFYVDRLQISLVVEVLSRIKLCASMTFPATTNVIVN